MSEEIKLTTYEVLSNQLADRRDEFINALPNGIDFDKFARIVKTGCIQNPDLLNSDRSSLLLSCLKSAQDGLLPDGRESALVVYNTKQKDGSYKKMVQYMPMYMGLLKKIRNSGELASLSAHVVYENDEFDYCLGDNEHITHKPALENRGKEIGAYVIVRTKDGAIYRDFMNYSDVERIRAMSRAKNSQAWVGSWGEMAKKTVIRRLAKLLPMSSDLVDAITQDDNLFDFNNKIPAPLTPLTPLISEDDNRPAKFEPFELPERTDELIELPETTEE